MWFYWGVYLFSLWTILFLVVRRQDWSQQEKKQAVVFVTAVWTAVIFGSHFGYFVLYQPQALWVRPSLAFLPLVGGMSFFSGLAAFLLFYLVFGDRRSPIQAQILSATALWLPLFLFLGRLGNALNQELCGAPLDSLPFFWPTPLSLNCRGVMTFPTQLLQGLVEGPILWAIVAWRWRRMAKFPSPERALKTGATFVIAYGGGRFLTEFLRAPEPEHFIWPFFWNSSLSLNQTLGLIFVVAGLLIFSWDRLR